jgi:hypothetical protein
MIIEEQGWWAAAFFMTFIISTSFTFLNMFIAVFTNTMASIDIEDKKEDVLDNKINQQIIDELGEINRKLDNLSVGIKSK